MAADSAVSTKIDGVTYRVTDMTEDEKVFVHGGAIIFCSGDIEKCGKIRSHIRTMDMVDINKIQVYAQKLFGHDTTDDSTGILIYWGDGNLVGMLSAQDFEPILIPWDRAGLQVFTLGYLQKEADETVKKYLLDDRWKDDPFLFHVVRTYYNLQCEEVGGKIHVFTREEMSPTLQYLAISLGSVRTVDRPPLPYREITKVDALALQSAPSAHAHGIVQARDFLMKDGRSIFTADHSKISGDFIDARGLTIVNAQGEDVLYMDESGIHWNQDYSPFKYQFARTANGPWHDEPTENDEYRRESSDGGVTWSAGIKYLARDGKDGKDGKDGSDATVPAYITQTKITQTTIESPTIVGGVVRGGRLESDSIIDIATDAKIGNKLIINASNLLGGIEFRGSNGVKIAEVYVDAPAKSLQLTASGGIFVNGERVNPTVTATFG